MSMLKSSSFFAVVPVIALGFLGTAFLHERAAEASLQGRLLESQQRAQNLERELEGLQVAGARRVGGALSAGGKAPAPRTSHEAAAKMVQQETVLPAGDELFNSARLLSVAKAVDLCSAIPECKGFTFMDEGVEGVPSRVVKVFFKTAWRPMPADKKWRSVIRPPATPAGAVDLPVDPGYDLFGKFKERIHAEYDVERIAKYGQKVAFDAWPEYNVSHDRAVFEYPKPAPDVLPVSVSPMVYFMPQMLSRAEAQAIIDTAAPRLQRSEVARGKLDANESHIDNVRTSSGAWLNDEDASARVLRDRIQDLTGVARGKFEQLQVLRYEEGQKYGSHVDYFHPSTYGDARDNRMATMITFLSDVADGGSTSFPLAMGSSVAERKDRVDCASGVRIDPVMGGAVLFYSMRQDMVFDPASRHGGCPVGRGQHKWVAVQWLRYSFADFDGHPPIAKF